MRGGWTLAAIFVGSVSTSCIRTPQDVEPPGEGGTLTGQVTLRDLATTNFVPAEGIRVHVVGTSRYRFTDGFGRFQIDRLPLGTYALEVEEPSDEGQTTPRSLRLDGIRLQSDGQALGLGEIQLNAPGTLQGTVRLRTSDVPFVAPGTLISVVGTAFRAFTGENGAYTLAGLPEGVFDLIVSRPGFAPARIRGASVLSAVRLTLDPVLLEATDETFMVEVIGRVQQDDGAPADAVTVTMTPPSGTALTTTTDINGAFRLNVPAGVYRVRAEKDDFVAVELDGVFALREGVLGLVPLSLRRPPPEDLDEDGIPDVEDPDIDNDGVINSEDIAPRDPTRGRDSDGDGVPDEEDFDADGDGLDEEEELGPGADGWVTNPFDADTDGDGIDDDDDNCPTFANPDQRDGDGDGRGDACEEQDAFVTEVRPTQAGPGDAVDIIGGGFPSDAGQVAVRFGLGGPAILAERATASTITVRVPTDAETGNVTVYLPRESLVAPQSFCFLPLPELRGFVQTTVRPGDLIGVAGRHLSSPSCRLPAAAPIELVLTSASGTVRAPLVGAIGSVIFEEQQLELANFVVPVEATAGPAFVEGADGASSAANVQVDALDVQIQSASPQLLNPGDTLRLLGVGLAPPTGTDLEVVFPPSIVIVVDPQNVRDEEVVVTVPNGFTSGDLILRHAGGQSTWPIDRIADQPAVTRRSPSLIVAGQTEVTIVGSFLQDTVEVRFTGAINNTAAPMLASAGIVEVDAPVGAEPGPIVLVDSAGGVTPVPAVATLTSAGSEATFANSMLAFRRVGPSIELMSFSGRNVTIVDPESLTAVGDPTLLPFLTPTENVLNVASRPSLDRGVITTDGLVYIADFAGFVEIGRCPASVDPGASGANFYLAWRFTPDERYAFNARANTTPNDRHIIVRADMQTGDCTTIDLGPAGTEGRTIGLLPLSNSRMIITGEMAGVATVDIDESSPSFGTIIEPFNDEAFRRSYLLLDNRLGVIWGGHFNTRDLKARWIDPSDTRRPPLIGGGFGPLVRQPNGRWVGSWNDIYDLTEQSRPYRFPNPTSNIIAHPSPPGGAAAVLYRTVVGLRRYEIRE